MRLYPVRVRSGLVPRHFLYGRGKLQGTYSHGYSRRGSFFQLQSRAESPAFNMTMSLQKGHKLPRLTHAVHAVWFILKISEQSRKSHAYLRGNKIMFAVRRAWLLVSLCSFVSVAAFRSLRAPDAGWTLHTVQHTPHLWRGYSWPFCLHAERTAASYGSVVSPLIIRRQRNGQEVRYDFVTHLQRGKGRTLGYEFTALKWLCVYLVRL